MRGTARYSMRGTVEGPIKHEVKPNFFLLILRPYLSAVSSGTARTGHAIS